MTTRHFLGICLFFLAFPVFCQETLPFSANLSPADRATLNDGGTIVRRLKKNKDMSLIPCTDDAQTLMTNVTELKPSYLAEVIKILPYKGNEDLPDRIEKLVTNFHDYIYIPYFSEYNNQIVLLFQHGEELSRSTSGETTTYKVNLQLGPFTPYNADVVTHKNNNTFYYLCTNTEAIYYHFFFNFTAVAKDKMCIGMVVVRSGDTWVLYATGGVRAPWFPFVQDRIETAFINRIKDFSMYVLKNY